MIVIINSNKILVNSIIINLNKYKTTIISSNKLIITKLNLINLIKLTKLTKIIKLTKLIKRNKINKYQINQNSKIK
jgi:hypothetical protein